MELSNTLNNTLRTLTIKEEYTADSNKDKWGM
jgi:hypothetical protein